jgi:hypothetical protein
MDNIHSPTSSITENTSGSANVLKLARGWQPHQKWEQQKMEEHKDVQNIDDSISSIVLEPSELYEKGILSEDEIQELFIEMCFFARLGFLQPPCCLLCTYQETMEGSSPDFTCSRWVIWRRNAETRLHPNQLEDNIVVTKCCVARSLLKGNVEDGHAWDTASKKLVICSAIES